MNFEETQRMIEGLEMQNGFSPADLIDFPSPVVEILRNLMSRRIKNLTGLSTKLNLQSDQVVSLLELLAMKGLVAKAEGEGVDWIGYEVCLKP